MAITYTLPTTAQLNHSTPFNQIMTDAMGAQGLLDAAITKIEAYSALTEMTDIQKASLVADTLAKVTSSITTAAMSTALSIAKENRDGEYNLTKTREETELIAQQRLKLVEDTSNATKDNALKTQQLNNMVVDGWKTQAELVREYGIEKTSIPSFDVTKLTGMEFLNIGTAAGIKYHQAASLAEDYLVKKQQVNSSIIDGWARQVDTVRDGGLLLGEGTSSLDANTVFLEESNLDTDAGLKAAQEASIKADAALKDKQADKTVIDSWKIQADLYADNGYDVSEWVLTDGTLQESPALYAGIKDAQAKQIHATTYNTYAKSFRENGVIQYAFSPTGDKGRIKSANGYTPDGVTQIYPATEAFTGLTGAQTDIAIRQEKGFDENIMQHVANSSASFMSMLFASDKGGFATGTTNETLGADSPLEMYMKNIKKMNTLTGADSITV